jgi:hypothetical protein
VIPSSIVGGFRLLPFPYICCYEGVDTHIVPVGLLNQNVDNPDLLIIDLWSPSYDYFDSFTTDSKVCYPRTGVPSVAYCCVVYK